MSSERIGKKLVTAGLVTQAQLDEALGVLAQQGGSDVLSILVSLNYLTRQACIDYLAAKSTAPATDLSKHEISAELLGLVPKQFVLQHQVIPIGKGDGVLTLGAIEPLGSGALEELEQASGLSVQAVLCAADDVRNAIARYYPESEQAPGAAAANVDSPARLQNAAVLISKIDRLPALPETVVRVRRTMDDPGSSVADMAGIISMDPPIAAKVLSVANSAAYGFPQRVNDVNLGVTLLGMRETYCLVLSCSVLNYAEKTPAFDYRSFWRRSMWCTAASRVIAKRCGLQNAFGLYSGALLHGLGEMALGEVAPELYSQIDQSLAPDERIAQEESVLGMAHTEAGYVLATQWELPLEIAEPIRLHLRPELAHDALDNVMVVALAVALSRASGVEGEAAELFVGSETPREHLGIEEDALAGMVAEYLVEREGT